MARTTKKYVSNNNFKIYSNGQTESLYFEIIKNKFNSPYSIKIKHINADPLQLVQYAIEQKENCRNVWCVFDIDKSFEDGQLLRAITLAEEHNIRIAWSNISFEVWLIHHFQQYTKNSTARNNLTYFKSLLKHYDYADDFKKTDKKILEKLVDNKLFDAVQNSKINFQNRAKEHQQQHSGHKGYEIWKWNSCTNMFKLIEAIKIDFKPIDTNK